MRRESIKTILCTIGTRPEAIKMAPVIRAFKAAPWAQCRILFTAQHRELVDQMFEFFEIEPNIDLDIMRHNQSLVGLTAQLLERVHDVLGQERPDMVLAQGDTTTVLATALASFYHKVPFGHVEAGLRTHQLYAPFPEEANRVIAGHLSTVHFAPTATARDNLLREGITPGNVHITGNTVIDALLMTAQRAIPLGIDLDSSKRLVLITAHRRDSFGEPIRLICQAVQELHDQFPDVEFVWPVHPNPAIKPIVEQMMNPFERVFVCPPLGYGAFVSAMKRATLILTDSGGVQEEAPALGKPVLVMRGESERPEAIAAGVAKLVGRDPWTIVRESSRLLQDPKAYRRMARGTSPYGDGHAAERIVSIVGQILAVPGALRIAG
ncbi:MAG TPA: UDP-N-acetylglucosamine 2-epimerase (non-hydrolyzing) [Isosphaeraceae bacterium]|nr:UDP-N-acetylglucosamine 2-epimerase (non-hydrolyzing) [Isosphaeraceae bacterium]